MTLTKTEMLAARLCAAFRGNGGSRTHWHHAFRNLPPLSRASWVSVAEASQNDTKETVQRILDAARQRKAA